MGKGDVSQATNVLVVTADGDLRDGLVASLRVGGMRAYGLDTALGVSRWLRVIASPVMVLLDADVPDFEAMRFAFARLGEAAPPVVVMEGYVPMPHPTTGLRVVGRFSLPVNLDGLLRRMQRAMHGQQAA